MFTIISTFALLATLTILATFIAMFATQGGGALD